MNTTIPMRLSGLLLVASMTFAAAPSAPKSFADDLSRLRKESIVMCSKLQKPVSAQGQSALLAEMDTIMAHWNALANTYNGNPPKEFSMDSKWASYFEEGSDNFSIMRARAVEGKYGRAAQFCGMNCMLFVTINQTNGIDKASDHLFMLRKVAKQAVEMANAGNWKGARATIEHGKEIEKRLATAPVPSGATDSDYRRDIEQLKEVYKPFKEAIDSSDQEAMGKAFKSFMAAFALVYPKYV